jgi:hypothetical protein
MIERLIILYAIGAGVSALVHLLSWTLIDHDLDKKISLEDKMYNLSVVSLLWVKYLPLEVVYVLKIQWVTIKFHAERKLPSWIRDRIFKKKDADISDDEIDKHFWGL